MIVSLDYSYRSELLLLPARNGNGVLQGVEIIVNFVGEDSTVRAPTELVLPRLTNAEKVTLFCEQLALIEACQLFLIQHHLTAWINISPEITEQLLTDETLAAQVGKFPCLELAINENYPDLNSGKEHKLLSLLAKQYPLVLWNFGVGNASTKAVFDGLFKRVMLDKNFIHQRLSTLAFEPFMRAIISQVKPYCDAVMIAGIDDEASLKRASAFQFSAMQGALWPAVTAAQLTSLIHP
ncbi:EAL domain-containing protein [Kosakonia cowanii]|uniref:EAL domain-containing protein n=1 Tax=Kosakonia cowanii TaxID=208223 RepID=UPI0023F7B642|nr:EAL domain-containing protein [Kosakonia cowanii]MDF7760844.1 EAL domain-containing protein [Kosakonia cowanii]